jgi:hypothetical protein
MGVQVSGGKQLKFFSFQKCFFERKYQLGGLLLRKICIRRDIGRAQ